MIAAYLEPTTLTMCMRVRRAFRLLFVPYLYRSVELVDEEVNIIFQEPAVGPHFRSVSHHVRQFVSLFGRRNGKLIVSAGVSNLIKLELSFEDVLVTEWLELTELVAQLVDSNALLCRLRLTGPSNWFAFPFLLDVASQLTHLDLDFQGARLPPMTLQLDDDDFVDGGRLPALRSMSLANFKGSGTWLLLLLRECPELREVTLKQQQYWMPSEGSRLELAHLLRGVKSVVWRAEEIRGGDLREVLELGSPESKSESTSAPEVDSLAPLIESAACIQSLALDHVLRRADVQSELQQFLEAATKLKELRLQTTAPCDRWSLVLTPLMLFGSTSPLLRNHVPRTWGCARTLTRLEILVQRLPSIPARGGAWSHTAFEPCAV